MEEYQKKKRKRKRQILLAAVVLLAVAVAGLASLRIRSVHIEGNQHYTAEELEAYIFPDDWERNPLLFLYHTRTGKSKEIPFVEKYSVTMTGFSSVDIVVYEKNMIGYVDMMGCCLYFDDEGYVVESSSERIANIPRVTGLATDHVVLGDRLPVKEETIFQEVLNVSQYLQNTKIQWNQEEKTLVELVDTIHLDEGGGVTCILGDISVYLGNHVNMEDKLLEMSNILPNLYGRTGTLYLDTYTDNMSNPTYIFK